MNPNEIIYEHIGEMSFGGKINPNDSYISMKLLAIIFLHGSPENATANAAWSTMQGVCGSLLSWKDDSSSVK